MEVTYATVPYGVVGQDVAIEYESLIWTERFRNFGDFKMVVKENNFLLEDLRVPHFLLSSTSGRVMYIETVEIEHQSNGPNLLTISGNSIESILRYRYFPHNTIVNPPGGEQATTVPAGVRTRKYPSEIIFDMVRDNCTASGGAPSADRLPGLSMGTNVMFGSNDWYFLQRGTVVYELLTEFAQEYEFGFEIVQSATKNELLYNQYFGVDRSVPTSANYVMFSPSNDTLINPKTFRSIHEWVNHVQFRYYTERIDVSGTGVRGASITGWNKRSVVMHDDSTTEPSFARQKAWNVLAEKKNRYQNLVEGEVRPEVWAATPAKLGDIVVLKDKYGNKTKVRIEEVVHVKDARGVRIYPTFEEVL